MKPAVSTASRNVWSAAAAVATALCISPLAAQTVVTAGASTRSYRIGDTTLTEGLLTARYQFSTDRLRVRIDGATVKFSAPATTINGNLPFGARIDFERQPGDTITGFVRTASRPFDLDSRETTALSSGGTATVDLQGTSLGTSPIVGGRAVFSFPAGAMILAVRGGVEIEPRPSGAGRVYWRGNTARGGLSLTSSVGDASLTGSIDMAASTADSLGGRNLFPGGGNLVLQLLADGSLPLGASGSLGWPVRGAAFYTRAFDNERADQPNLIIPQGNVIGALGSLLIPVDQLTILPGIQYLRESSASTSKMGLVTSEVSGQAWTMEASLDLSIPLGPVFELTPQSGYTVGNVGSSTSNALVARRGRAVGRSVVLNDSIRGGWFGLQLSATF